MTPGGWIFLMLSVGFVWSLAIWCYAMILSPEPSEEDV